MEILFISPTLLCDTDQGLIGFGALGALFFAAFEFAIHFDIKNFPMSLEGGNEGGDDEL